MLFRLFRRQAKEAPTPITTPIRGAQLLFATPYAGSCSYPRLVPRNTQGLGTIACLRRDCKRVIKTLVEKYILPDDLVLDELDMVACHTGIYVGLTGAVNAPHTWEAYSTVNFWSHIMSKWGSDQDQKAS